MEVGEIMVTLSSLDKDHFGMAASSHIILGIDPGTQITGYGLIAVKGKQITLLSYGSIRLERKKTDAFSKLERIFSRVAQLIETYQPTEMALEAPFYGKNVQSMLKLGRAQGVALAAGLQAGIPIFEYSPRKIKQAVTGNGNASKWQVAKMLEQLLDFESDLEQPDATDGLAVGVCHYFQRRPTTEGKSYKDWASFLDQNPARIKKKR